MSSLLAPNVEAMCSAALRAADFLAARGLEDNDETRSWLMATLRWARGEPNHREMQPLTRALRRYIERMERSPVFPMPPAYVLALLCYEDIRDARSALVRGLYEPRDSVIPRVAAVVWYAGAESREAAQGMVKEWQSLPY